MKILYLTGEMFEHGGIEHVLALKLNYLANTEHEVCLSTYEECSKPFVYPVSDKVSYYDLGVNYNVDEIGDSYFSMRCLKKVPKHYKRTKALIRQFNPDVIVVPNGGFEYWFLPLIKNKAKILREFHSSQFFRPNNKSIVIKLDNFLQRFYDAIVVLTPQEMEYFQYKKNIVVIPNPIVDNPLKSDLMGKKIIAVGRIAPVKGFDKFVDIASIIVPKHPDYIFEIWGNGDKDLMKELNSKIEKNGLINNVFLRGRTSEVPKKLAESAIYACTSVTECFPLSLMEAQEAGVPIVSFDCPNGPRNIINNGEDGFLVADQSVEQAAKAILKLIENESLRKEMGKKALENSKRFHINAIMNKWIELFKKL